jgi:NAD-dependent SIR2 family protein deacetylase
MYSQRYQVEPHEGYRALLDLVVKSGKDDDYFIWTSNVDGMFDRAGFDVQKIYKPQGDWQYLQCAGPCSPEAVYDSKSIIESVLPYIKDCQFTDPSKIPLCPRCQKHPLRGNVRGGEWFIHDHYNATQDRMISWLRETEEKGLKLAIIEIGAGFNTPVVTRFPMESICRALKNAKLIRINPTEPEIPLDLVAVGIKKGWSVFEELSKEIKSASNDDLAKAAREVEKERSELVGEVREHSPDADLKQGVPLNFHWVILKSLRR